MWLEIIIGIMTIIQTFEFIYLIQSSRRTNQLIEDPAPILIGLINRIKEDPKFAQEFGSFIAWCGQTGIQGIKTSMSDAGIKVPKIRTLGDVFSALMQMPKIQQAIEDKITKAATGVMPAEVEKVAEGWGL